MKKAILLMLSAVLCGIIGSCSKNDLDFSLDSNKLKIVTSFEFLTEYNQSLSQDVKAEIDSVERTINAEVPFGTDVTSLSPTIEFVLGGERSQTLGEAQDFSELVHYETYGKDSLSLVYCITVVTRKSNEKRINSFRFLASDHDFLEEDFEFQIDEQAKTITGELPLGSDLSSLKPSIGISAGAKVELEIGFLDFTDTRTIKVIAEDGTEAKYMVRVTVGKSDAKAITSFAFLAEDNEKLSEEVGAQINEANKTITAEVPFGTDVTALIPSIELSVGATINPGNKVELDFSQAVDYTVTAANSSNVVYTVTISVKEPTERQVLVELYNANPDNTLGWDLEEQDISNWNGVVLKDGKIAELSLRSTGLKNIPSSIGSLSNLEKLSLDQNAITSIPASIGKLSNLKFLDLFSNSLTVLPAEIAELDNLSEIFLSNNALISLPISLSGWTNLTKLRLENNRLTSIPESIGDVKKLERLIVSNNALTSVPTSIGRLTNLVALNLSLNSLTSVPAEIGNLKELRFLYLQSNQLTVVPRVICDLDFEVFQKDLSVPCGE